jgi:uncharacterized membrane protein
MNYEKIIQIVILIHAAFGGLALLFGLAAIIAKKGNLIHKKSGLLFFYSMLISAIIAMFIAVLPKHENPFLFAIGIFSSYLILTGFRALRFKNAVNDLKTDKIISVAMFITGILMIILPVLFTKSINIVLSVFGLIGIALSYRDLQIYKKQVKLKKAWLKLHLGKMIGGYIAAITAFIVVNNCFSGIYGWFVPTLFGVPYIFYWFNKLKLRA